MSIATKAKIFGTMIALTVSSAVASCQTDNSQAAVSTPFIFKTLEIGIYGQIRKSDTNEALIALKKLPAGSRVKLRVNSPGGDVFTALSLAIELEKYDTTIEVLGQCHSACAQILLFSAKKIKFAPRSNVIFHTMPLSWIQYNLEEGRVTDKQYMINSLYLLQFYIRRRVPLDIIDCAAIAQEPFGATTVVDNLKNESNGEIAVTYARRVRKEGLYLREQDLDRVFASGTTIIDGDNLQRPPSSVSVSSLDQCRGAMSDGFVSAISTLNRIIQP